MELHLFGELHAAFFLSGEGVGWRGDPPETQFSFDNIFKYTLQHEKLYR